MTSRPPAVTTPRKKTYTTPSLTKYGQLKDLTTSGTGVNAENAGKSEPGKRS